MVHNRITEIEIWAGIFACLRERPMSMTEMAQKIMNLNSACSVGRVAIRIEAMMKGDMVAPMVAKGILFFRLNEIKERKA